VLVGPAGVAMAAGVEGDGVVAGVAQGLAGALPGVPGLAAAVLQHHQRAARVAPGVAGNGEPAAPGPDVHGYRGARQPLSSAHVTQPPRSYRRLLTGMSRAATERYRDPLASALQPPTVTVRWRETAARPAGGG